MSYFSLLGESLNTAISAVGNIVAPIDQDDEQSEDGSPKKEFRNYSLEEVAPALEENLIEYEASGRLKPPTFHSLGETEAPEKLSNGFSTLSGYNELQEQLDYFRIKTESLTIELREQTIKVEQMKGALSQLDEQRNDAIRRLSSTTAELEETDQQLEQARREITDLRTEFESVSALAENKSRAVEDMAGGAAAASLSAALVAIDIILTHLASLNKSEEEISSACISWDNLCTDARFNSIKYEISPMVKSSIESMIAAANNSITSYFNVSDELKRFRLASKNIQRVLSDSSNIAGVLIIDRAAEVLSQRQDDLKV